jgi:hypothetical protein
MNAGSVIHVMVISCSILFAWTGGYALDCPAPPEQARKDWETEVTAAVGKIGPVKGGELQTRTRTATVDLLGKLPEAGKIYLEQMMFAAYCSALRDDRKTPEAEKAQLLRTYSVEVRKTLSTRLQKNGPRPKAKQSPEAARIQLTQMSLAYTPEKFVQTARDGDETAVALFLAAGMDVNVTDNEGVTALMAAAGKGHSNIIEALIKAGGDVNKRKGGEPALSLAAEWGNIKTLRLLLSKGANAESVNKACWKAAYSRHHEVLRILVDHGADVTDCRALEAVIRGGRNDRPVHSGSGG